MLLALMTKLALLMVKRQYQAARTRQGDGRSPPKGDKEQRRERQEAARLPLATQLWRTICERTDQLYEVNEKLFDLTRTLFNTLIVELGVGKDEYKLVFGNLKDPIRCHEKALDDYGDRFSHLDNHPAEACVVDVIRSRLIIAEGSALVQVMHGLTKDGAPRRLEQRGVAG